MTFSVHLIRLPLNSHRHCEFSVYHELSLRNKRLKKKKAFNPPITGFRLYFPLSGADYSPNLTKIEFPHIYGKSLFLTLKTTVDCEECAYVCTYACV